MIRLYIILCAMIVCSCLPGQEIIYLENPSFEDEPQSGIAPIGWIDCGFSDETPPDIQPSGDPNNLIFGNSFPAQDGNTYLAMVVRENGTWERIGQSLTAPLKRGIEYEMSVYLTRPDYYLSPTRYGEEVHFTAPVVLRILGGNDPYDPREFLTQSLPIEPTVWEEYLFTFTPGQDCSWLFLEVYFSDSTAIPYNGGMFLDHCSPIYISSSGYSPSKQLEIELLIERIRNCYSLDDTADTLAFQFTHAEIIKRSSLFGSTIYKDGLDGFLESISLQDLSKVISCLNRIQCEDLGLLLVEAGSIYHSNKSDTNIEKRWKLIEKLERKCLKKLDKGELKVGIKSYVQAHFEKLNVEVENCE